MRPAVLLLAVLAACRPAPKTPTVLRLDRVSLATAVPLASAEDPVGVTASGIIAARPVPEGADSGFRLYDSTGAAIGSTAVPAIGVWMAGDEGNLYTLAPGALGIASVKPDGSPGPSFRLREAGVLRGIFADSADLMRPTIQGFAVVRVALQGLGERVAVESNEPHLQELFGVTGGRIGAADALPSTTSRPNRIVVGNGMTYQIMYFSPNGEFQGELRRDLPKTKLTKRKVEAEIAQITASQQLNDRYVAALRKQLEDAQQPFFTTAQGFRFDGAGLLWVVGNDADSAFADVFSDTTFVRRFPLPCSGFDGQWDLKGDFLVLGCARPAEPAEIQLYRIGGR